MRAKERQNLPSSAFFSRSSCAAQRSAARQPSAAQPVSQGRRGGTRKVQQRQHGKAAERHSAARRRAVLRRAHRGNERGGGHLVLGPGGRRALLRRLVLPRQHLAEGSHQVPALLWRDHGLVLRKAVGEQEAARRDECACQEWAPEWGRRQTPSAYAAAPCARSHLAPRW